MRIRKNITKAYIQEVLKKGLRAASIGDISAHNRCQKWFQAISSALHDRNIHDERITLCLFHSKMKLNIAWREELSRQGASIREQRKRRNAHT